MELIETFVSLLKILFACFVIYRVSTTLYAERKDFGFILRVWQQFRLSMIVEIPSMLIVLSIAILLLYQVPLLQYGWMNLFYQDGGNIAFAPFQEGAQSDNGLIRAACIGLLALFFVAFPFFAKYEEEAFRRGHYQWKDIAVKSVQFGLMHLIVGIPIAVGIALIIPGLFYGYKYRRIFYKEMVRTLGLGKVSFREMMAESKRVEIEERKKIATAAEEKAFLTCVAYHTANNTFIMAVILYMVTG
jgi:ABC-type multidrug transport system permease subunit